MFSITGSNRTHRIILRFISQPPARLNTVGISDDAGLIIAFPNNGSFTPIGSANPSELVAQQLAALDAGRRIYYIIAFNTTSSKPTLIGFSLADGSIITSAPLNFYESDLVGVGQTMAVERSGKVIVAGRFSANGPHVIGLVDPITGNFTQKAQLSAGLQDPLGGAAAYDDTTDTYLLSLVDAGVQYYYSVSMATGNYTRWPEVWATGSNLQTIDFDPVSGYFWGLGILAAASDDDDTRVVVRMDAQTFNLTIMGSIKGYLLLLGPIAALDSTNRVLYWMGAESTNPEGGFYYVGVSLVNASVVSVSSSPVTQPEPWSLEMLNVGSGGRGGYN